MPSLLMLPGKFKRLDFYNSPYLYKRTFQVTFSTYFIYSTYFIFSGGGRTKQTKKNLFFHLLQAKLGVQITATVTPQRPGVGGERLTLLLPLAPQRP